MKDPVGRLFLLLLLWLPPNVLISQSNGTPRLTTGTTFFNNAQYDSTCLNKQYTRTLKAVKSALALDRSLYEEPHDSIGESYVNVARVYSDLAMIDSAFYYFQKALAQFDNGKERNIRMADPVNNIARIYNLEGRHKEALKNCNKALLYCGIKIAEESILLPGEEELQGNELVPVILAERGKALRELYDQEYDPRLLEAAIDNYLTLASLSKKIIRENKLEQSKLDRLQKTIPAYHEAIDCAVELYRIHKDEKYNEMAFRFAEESKALLLLLTITESNAKKYAGIPDSLIAREDELRKKVSALENELSQLKETDGYSSDSAYLAKKEAHFSTLSTLNTFTELLKKDYPQYYRLKYTDPAAGQSLLKKDFLRNAHHALLEYVVGDEEVFIFVLTARNFRLFRIENSAGTREAALRLHESLAGKNTDAGLYTKLAFPVYKALFYPVESMLTEEHINQLTIVPDDYIHYVPFGLLVSKPPSQSDFSKMPYLIRDYRIHYQYSVRLVLETQALESARLNKMALAFAPDFSNISSHDLHAYQEITGDDMGVLAGARNELTRISTLFTGDYFTDRQATENNFKKLADDYKIIHLATHAIIDDRNPNLSKLIFSAEDDTLEDGNLFSYELFNMKLNAELVTLSACNTGFGKRQKGEGFMSLARGFAYAGCPNVVMSLWPASGKSTAGLMGYFYEGLKRGLPKDEALRAAKLKYLENADPLAANPYYWGNFIFVGDPAPLQAKNRFSKSWITWVTGLIIIAGLSVLVFWKSKETSSGSSSYS